MQRIVILHGQLTHSPWVSRFGYIVYILLQDHAHYTHHAQHHTQWGHILNHLLIREKTRIEQEQREANVRIVIVCFVL